MVKLNKAEEYFKENYSELKKLRNEFHKSKRIKNKTIGNLRNYIYKKTRLMPSVLMAISLSPKDTYAKYKKLRF